MIKEHDIVELTRPINGIRKGTRAVVISAWTDYDHYTLEIRSEYKGPQLQLINVSSSDIKPKT